MTASLWGSVTGLAAQATLVLAARLLLPTRFPLAATLLLPALGLLAGCGASFAPQPAGAVRIILTPQALHTGEPLRLAAIVPGTGETASVRWQILSSNNAPALGSGSIAADGVYTAPGVLSRDAVTVTLAATLPGATAEPATTTLTIAPGFAEPLQPENATLTPGSSIQLRAQLAEVGSGTVRWRLAAADGSLASNLSLDPGTLSQQHCQRSSRQFTTCTVTYTAPSAAAASPSHLSVIATVGELALPSAAEMRARLVIGSLNSNPALHQAEQRGAIALGGSGSNDSDFDTYDDPTGARYIADCCGGTLGALVEDAAGTPYILSNNHVLATSDQGHPGDTIDQPGLIDDACVPLRAPGAQLEPVGTLRYAVPLAAAGTNVDAALASIATDAVRSDGAILELAPVPASHPSSPATATLASAAPTAGIGERLDAALLNSLSVVKSGRTTGLTCSTVDAVDLRVAVDYYKDCAETQPYTTKVFTGQLGIGGDGFADSGDSGALVLDAANAEAVGLLYATASSGYATAGSGYATASSGAYSRSSPGTGLTLANPIGDVLGELGKQANSALTLAGSATSHRLACLDYDQGGADERAALGTLPPDERTRALAGADAASALRGARTGVLAVAPGVSADDPGTSAILLYLDSASTGSASTGNASTADLPATVAGVRTVPIPLDPETIARGQGSWPSAPAASLGLHLTAAALAAAEASAERVAPRLMQDRAIFGVGVAQSLDNPGEPALLLLLDVDAGAPSVALALAEAAGAGAAASQGAGLPATLGGLRVRYLRMHRFRVTRSKYVTRGAASSCALRSITAPR